jgi:hypothetical protein
MNSPILRHDHDPITDSHRLDAGARFDHLSRGFMPKPAPFIPASMFVFRAKWRRHHFDFDIIVCYNRIVNFRHTSRHTATHLRNFHLQAPFFTWHFS